MFLVLNSLSYRKFFFSFAFRLILIEIIETQTQTQSLKENLLYGVKELRTKKKNLYALFFSGILLSLLCLSIYSTASLAGSDSHEQNQQNINFGAECVTSYTDSDPLVDKISQNNLLKIADSKIQFNLIKDQLDKQSAFKSLALSKSFIFCPVSLFNNSFTQPFSTFNKVVRCHYTKQNVSVFVHLMNIYKVAFSKTAALCRFLFSRPPPFFLKAIHFSL